VTSLTVIASGAKQSMATRNWIASSLALLAMTKQTIQIAELTGPQE